MEVKMQQTEANKPPSSCCNALLKPADAKWLEENRKEMDQNVKHMLELIETDDFLANSDTPHKPNKLDLSARVQNLYSIYQALAGRYDHLTGELNERAQFGVGQNSLPVTPDQKMGQHRFGHQSVLLSSCGGSSDPSSKEGNDLSSPLDSDSGSFSSSSNDGIYVELETEIPSMKDKLGVPNGDRTYDMVKMEGNKSYRELIGRLKTSNIDLELSEENIAGMKCELEEIYVRGESMFEQLQLAERDDKLGDVDLKLERRQVHELQKEIIKLEAFVSDSTSEIERLREELGLRGERLKASEEEVAKLKYELGNNSIHNLQDQLNLIQEDKAMLEALLDSERRQAMELQEKIACCNDDLFNRDCEVKELKFALQDERETLFLERAQLQSHIVGLTEELTLLNTRLREWQLHGNSLEDQLRQCKTENMEMKRLHDAKEMEMHGQIDQLRADLAKRGEEVEVLNKKLDGLRLKYDMLMVEKDNLNAEVNTLSADLSSRDQQIVQARKHLCQLQGENLKLISGNQGAQKLVDGLKVRVEELQKDVDRQKIVILDGAEEKREAIRQLCFSLEHYRSGYKELHKALLKHKRCLFMV